MILFSFFLPESIIERKSVKEMQRGSNRYANESCHSTSQALSSRLTQRLLRTPVPRLTCSLASLKIRPKEDFCKGVSHPDSVQKMCPTLAFQLHSGKDEVNSSPLLLLSGASPSLESVPWNAAPSANSLQLECTCSWAVVTHAFNPST